MTYKTSHQPRIAVTQGDSADADADSIGVGLPLRPHGSDNESFGNRSHNQTMEVGAPGPQSIVFGVECGGLNVLG